MRIYRSKENYNFKFVGLRKSEFEKVNEWDTTIQDTMEEYDNVER